MSDYIAFDTFAGNVIDVYQRDKEGFWELALAPFLDDKPINPKNITLGLRFGAWFSGLEKDSQKLLNSYSLEYGMDIASLASFRLQYLKDAYPVFAFLAVWMYERNLSEQLEKFGDILALATLAVSGYSILDSNIDTDKPIPVEILIAELLISEYERLSLSVFGECAVNMDILARMKRLFLKAEIREKSTRWKTSPYVKDYPKQLGAKAANAVSPFMLSLEKAGKIRFLEDYWNVFLSFGAAIQMIDDWEDLEEDVSNGHYSWLTLDYEKYYGCNNRGFLFETIRDDKELVRKTFDTCLDLLDDARRTCHSLGDLAIEKLVDVTEARVRSYYRSRFKIF